MKRVIWAMVAGLAWSGAAQAGETRTALHYTGYALGLPVMSLSVDLAETDQGYRVGLEYRTTGLFHVLFPVDRRISAIGVSGAAGVRPARYEVDGQAGGRIYHAIVRFGGGEPVVQDESPPQPAGDPRSRFQPVPPVLTLNSIDYISAVLGLMRQVAAGGGCERDAHVFDGRMLTDLRAASAPDEALTAGHGAVFAGLARKCRFTGQVLAGGQPPPPGRPRRPPVGFAWIAPVGPGGEMWLVRLAFLTAGGSLTFYLDQNHSEPILALTARTPAKN